MMLHPKHILLIEVNGFQTHCVGFESNVTRLNSYVWGYENSDKENKSCSPKYTIYKIQGMSLFFLPPLSYVAFPALNSFSSFGVILVVMKSKQVYGIWCKDWGLGGWGRKYSCIPLYGFYKYLWPQGVWVFSHISHKQGIDLAILVVNSSGTIFPMRQRPYNRCQISNTNLPPHLPCYILFILNTYILNCNVFTYAPPGNQLLLCVASVVK